MLWRSRSRSLGGKEIVESAFRGIVSDELQKMKLLSVDDSNSIVPSHTNDVIWEYDGLPIDSNPFGSESEDLLIEMERLLYKDLQEELIRKELATYEEEEEFLAQAVFEHMQLNDNQACKNDKVWCPVCKRGELRETHLLIYCTLCQMRLPLDGKGNLELLRSRLGEIHMQHLDRGCKAAPKFRMDTEFGLTALYMQCEVCNTFDIVV